MHVRLELDGEEHELWVAREGDTVKIEVDGETIEVRLREGHVVSIGEENYHIEVEESDVCIAGVAVPFHVHEFTPGGAPGDHKAGGARGGRVKPPMPGKIVSIAINEGDEVQQGQVLLILEAMKMQNEIVAPGSGTVKKVHVKQGQNVEARDILVEIE